jgi:hypothetical protein
LDSHLEKEPCFAKRFPASPNRPKDAFLQQKGA